MNAVAWRPSGEPIPLDSYGDLSPKDVFWEFDGPKLFTCEDSAGRLQLAHQLDEGGGELSFLVVPINTEWLQKLKDDAITVRQLLSLPRAPVIVLGYGWEVKGAWHIEIGDVPNDMLPEPQITINYADEPLISVRLIPSKLGRDGVTASVIRDAAMRPIAALKRLAEYIEGQVDETMTASKRLIRRFTDPPAVRFAFNSFEVVFARPPAVPTDLVNTTRELAILDDRIVAQFHELLQLGLSICSSEWVSDDADPDLPRKQAAVKAVHELAPSESGHIDEIQVRGGGR